MRRTSRYLWSAGVVAAALALSSALAGAAGAATSGAPVSAFYLVIGASDSLGVQPQSQALGGARTHAGYANDVVLAEAARGVNLDMTQVGCPGETTYTAINGGDRCYSGTTTQLSLALDFLHAHYSDTGLVTIDLGFNNLLPCLRGGALDPTCVDAALPQLRLDMTTILTALKAAAGPHVTIVGLTHFNPYLASALAGSTGKVIASDSVEPLANLNKELADVYGSFGVAVANEVAAFQLDATTHHHTAQFGLATHICSLTYMCRTSHAPNFHPDSHGYHLIAEAIIDALGPHWPS